MLRTLFHINTSVPNPKPKFHNFYKTKSATLSFLKSNILIQDNPPRINEYKQLLHAEERGWENI